MREEHTGEDGLFQEVVDEKGKVSRTLLTERMKEFEQTAKEAAQSKAKYVPKTSNGAAEDDELTVLRDYEALTEQEADANRKLKEAQRALNLKVVSKYGALSVDEIKILVVDDKWLAKLAVDVQSELDRVSYALAGRITLLAERYLAPLPKLTDETETLSARVDGHLKKMGFKW